MNVDKTLNPPNPKPQNGLNPWYAVKPAYAYASKLLSCSAIIR